MKIAADKVLPSTEEQKTLWRVFLTVHEKFTCLEILEIQLYYLNKKEWEWQKQDLPLNTLMWLQQSYIWNSKGEVIAVQKTAKYAGPKYEVFLVSFFFFFLNCHIHSEAHSSLSASQRLSTCSAQLDNKVANTLHHWHHRTVAYKTRLLTLGSSFILHRSSSSSGSAVVWAIWNKEATLKNCFSVSCPRSLNTLTGHKGNHLSFLTYL